MGFPSPAADFVETRLNIDKICQTDGNSLIVKTSTGYAVIDRSLKAKPGNIVLITLFDRNHFARVNEATLQTDDGQTLSGDELNEVHVEGVLTFNILSTSAIFAGGQE